MFTSSKKDFGFQRIYNSAESSFKDGAELLLPISFVHKWYQERNLPDKRYTGKWWTKHEFLSSKSRNQTIRGKQSGFRDFESVFDCQNFLSTKWFEEKRKNGQRHAERKYWSQMN